MTELQVLPKSAQAEVVEVFEQAQDFRTIGEKITAPLDAVIEQTMEIIKKDPILNVSSTLEKMNKEMNLVYAEIIDNDGAVMRFFKKIPVIGIVAKKADEIFDSVVFDMQEIDGKISSIFSGFDQSYKSLGVSIDMQKNFLEGIDTNIEGVIAYKNFLATKIEEFKQKLEKTTDEDEKIKMGMFLRNVEFFLSNLVVLIGNLEMAKKRLMIRLDSAHKLSLAMNSSKPIFKTLLSSAVIEISGQKAIEASLRAMESMGRTIDKLSTSLTDKAIEGNKKAEEMSSKPVLSSSLFVENVLKLKNHFAEIEVFRAQVKLEAEAERVEFANAEKTLKSFKTLNAKSQEELNEILESGAEVITNA